MGVGKGLLQRYLRGGRALGWLPKTRYELLDVVEHRKTRRYSFYRPQDSVIARIKPGDQVQLNFLYTPRSWHRYSGERMWVRVTAREGETFEGELLNRPSDMVKFRRGDMVRFEHRHIVDTTIERLPDEKNDDPDSLWMFCMTSKSIQEGAPVEYLARNTPLPHKEGRKPDSGWTILAEGESGSELYAAGDARTLPLCHVLNHDDRWLHLIDEPPGQHFQWDKTLGQYVRLTPFEPEPPDEEEALH